MNRIWNRWRQPLRRLSSAAMSLQQIDQFKRFYFLRDVWVWVCVELPIGILPEL